MNHHQGEPTMAIGPQPVRIASLLLLLALSIQFARAQNQATYDLSLIDHGPGWVSSYWGYNAPKLIYDGTSFYTIGLWGDKHSTSHGVIYKYQDGQWARGYEWNNLNYQPGMLLLDSQKRLIVIYSQMDAGPVVLRADAPGDITHFTPIPIPAGFSKAGYMGAAIHKDRIVFGYIGGDDTYSFYFITLDLLTMKWSEPALLARAQRGYEPYTTWLYPLILPDDNGFHLVVSNNAYVSFFYDRINYTYVPYDKPTLGFMEAVVDCIPWRDHMACAEALWQGQDGSLYLTAQYSPINFSTENNLYVYRRDPQTRQWTNRKISKNQIAAIYQNAREPGTLWLSSTWYDQLKLYRSTDQGANWQEMSLPGFSDKGISGAYFLHGINPASGSVMPEVPCAVFSSGTTTDMKIWFVKFNPPPTEK